MKTFRLSILLALSVLATAAASAQTRPASSTAARTTTAKPASTAAKPASSATSKTATTAKPASSATKPAATTAKPAAKPAAVVEEEASPAKPSTTKSAAQSQASGGNEFGVGSMAANLGVGLGIGYGYGVLGGVSSTPALNLSVERGIIDNVGPGVISVGGLVGFKRTSWNYSGYRSSWNNFFVAARGAYHYNFLENPKVDTYAGLSVGVRVESFTTNYDLLRDNYNYGRVAITSGIFVGGRYMFTDNLGAFGELGYDMSYLKLGLTARF